jgi:hypothetical protein
MVMENALLDAYRMFFVTTEMVALAVAIVLVQLQIFSIINLLIIVTGAILTVAWCYVVGNRTVVVDEWKLRLYKETREDPKLSEYFQFYGRTGLHIRSARLWLDIAAPIYVGVLWLGFYLILTRLIVLP